MSKNELQKRFKVLNPEILDKYYDNQQSIVAVSGHYATWDWFSGFNYYSKHHFMALYKPLHNPYFDKLIKDLREKHGIGTIPSNQILRELATRKNETNIYWFIADQRPQRKDIRYWTTFLNQDTPILLGAEKIAKRMSMPVIFIDIRCTKRGFYEVELIPLFENAKETKEFEISEMHTRMLEKRIMKEPAYWLWAHNRWKHPKR